MTPLKKHELLYLIGQLRGLGLTQKEIGETLHISQQRVSYALRKLRSAIKEVEEE